MQGQVNSRYEPILRIKLRGPTGVQLEIDAIVDTGYSSSLSLPGKFIEVLELENVTGGVALLADGSFREYSTYSAEIEWEGSWKRLLLSDVADETLIGMSLLAGHKLEIDVVPGGQVNIFP